MDSKKRKRSGDSGSADKQAVSQNQVGSLVMSMSTKKEPSKTSKQLLEVTQAQAQASVDRLVNGYIPDRSMPGYQPSALPFGPAVHTPAGCVLVQKKPSVQILPPSLSI